MANRIKLKRGSRLKLPTLAYGEPAFTNDEGELYIGSEHGNVKLTKNKEIKELQERIANIVSHNGDGTKDTELIDARKGEATLRDKMDKIDGSIEEVERYMASFPAKGGKEYGIRFMKNSSSPTGVRLGDAIGLVANVGVGNERAINDFDKIYPWGHRRVCNLNNYGKVVAYEGDPTFARDGSNGHVMVETPIFYIKYVETDEYEEYWVSDYFAPGYRISPRFKRADGTIINNSYIGAYKAGLVDNKLVSHSGIFPKVEAGRNTFRNWAKANNPDFGLTDIAYRCDILEYLFIIEFGTKNSQALMQGLTTFSWDYKTTATTENSNALTLDSSNIAVGFTLRINGTDRRVISTDKTNKTVVLDGEPFTIASDVTISSRGWICGETDKVKSSSGSMLSNNDGKNCCVYRGEESPWGNIWEWVDGCNIKDNQAYIHWKPLEYADDKFTEPYTQLGYVNSNVNGYTKTMGFDENNSYARLPIETTGSSSTYFCDYYYQSLGNRAPLVGADLDIGSYAGLVYWHCAAGFSSSSRSFGARLSYKSS